eukprot:gene10549-biopygen13853
MPAGPPSSRPPVLLQSPLPAVPSGSYMHPGGTPRSRKFTDFDGSLCLLHPAAPGPPGSAVIIFPQVPGSPQHPQAPSTVNSALEHVLRSE